MEKSAIFPLGITVSAVLLVFECKVTKCKLSAIVGRQYPD